MPALLARSPRWADRMVSPPWPHLVVDRGHPLCPTRAWLPRHDGAVTTSASVGSPRIPELVRGYADAVIASTACPRGAGASRFGAGLEMASAAAGTSALDCGDETDLLPTNGVLTVIVHKRRTSAALVDGGAFGVLDGGVFTRRCGATVPFTDSVVYWDYGGVAAGTTRLSVGGLTFGDDVWAFTVGPRGMEIWQNGIKRASNAGTPTRVDSGGDFYVGSGNNTAGNVQPDNCVIAFCFLYLRQLAEGEIVSISSDPYQWLRPTMVPRRLVRFVGNTLVVTLDAITLQAQSSVARRTFGTRFCRVHRLFYVDDDRFPAPCARLGGHDPQIPG